MIHPGGLFKGDLEEPCIFCPGCKDTHVLPWKRGGWTFNGDTLKPTFMPSFRLYQDSVKGSGLCHFILTDGVINFCTDSTHPLAGKSVPLPEFPDETGDT